MKLVKKWLFPILTCLIVMGAAVLPPYISQVKDGRQFEQVHRSALNADALPIREPPDLLERLELYTRWHTPSETIPAFQTPEMDAEASTDLAVRALESLVQAGVIPGHLLRDPVKQAGADRILLWDLADSMGSQTPVEFWRVSMYLGSRYLSIDLDSESGCPVRLNLSDYNMAQWLKYQDPDTLPNLAECYFDLLGLEARLDETDAAPGAAPWERRFSVEGTDICYRFSFNATVLTVDLYQNGASHTAAAIYDG